MEAQFGFNIYQNQKDGGQVNRLRNQDYFNVLLLSQHIDVFAKTGFFLKKPGHSIGVLYDLKYHINESKFGLKEFNGEEKRGYINAIYDGIIGTTDHKYKIGVSSLYLDLKQQMNNLNDDRLEFVPGVFSEYTYTGSRLSAVLGARFDYHNLFKEQFSPTEYSDVPQDVVDDLTSKFTIKKFNEEMKDVFPIIHRLMKEDEVDQESDVVDNEKETLSNYFNKFESWVNELGEESAITSSDSEEQNQAITDLNKLLDKHFPSGVDGSNAISSLEGIIDDPRLEQRIKEIAKEDSDGCIRPLIKQWVEANAPEVMSKLDFGDMEETPEESAEPKKESADSKELAKFIYSFYDRETGKFPKGETGVLTMVEKKFGDRAASVAKGFINKLSEKHDNMGYSDKEIKMAFGVLNDPRYHQGNYSGAVATIEKIAKGLSQHPSVKKALMRANESTDELERIKQLSSF